MRHRTLTSETETDRVKTKVRETKQTKVQRNRLPSPVSARRVPSTAPLKLYVVNHARARRTARVILPYQHVARSVTRPRPAARWADEDELLVVLASRTSYVPAIRVMRLLGTVARRLLRIFSPFGWLSVLSPTHAQASPRDCPPASIRIPYCNCEDHPPCTCAASAISCCTSSQLLHPLAPLTSTGST